MNTYIERFIVNIFNVSSMLYLLKLNYYKHLLRRKLKYAIFFSLSAFSIRHSFMLIWGDSCEQKTSKTVNLNSIVFQQLFSFIRDVSCYFLWYFYTSILLVYIDMIWGFATMWFLWLLSLFKWSVMLVKNNNNYFHHIFQDIW